jgi:hypothetical protein
MVIVNGDSLYHVELIRAEGDDAWELGCCDQLDFLATLSGSNFV